MFYKKIFGKKQTFFMYENMDTICNLYIFLRKLLDFPLVISIQNLFHSVVRFIIL